MNLNFNFNGKTLLKNWWSIVKANFQTIQDTFNNHKTNPVIDHPDKSVTTTKLDDKSVTAAKLADKAVTASKLANQSVTADKLADDINNEFTNLEQMIRDEEKTRLREDGSIQTALGREKSDREAAESAINERIDNLRDSTEINAVKNAINTTDKYISFGTQLTSISSDLSDGQGYVLSVMLPACTVKNGNRIYTGGNDWAESGYIPYGTCFDLYLKWTAGAGGKAGFELITGSKDSALTGISEDGSGLLKIGEAYAYNNPAPDGEASYEDHSSLDFTALKYVFSDSSGTALLLAELETENKVSLVGAINEVNRKASSTDLAMQSMQALLGTLTNELDAVNGAEGTS